MWLIIFLAGFVSVTRLGFFHGITYGSALVTIVLASFFPTNEIVRFVCSAITAFNGGVVAFLFSLNFEVSLSEGQPIGGANQMELLAVLGAAFLALISSLLLAWRTSRMTKADRAVESTLAASRHAELLEAASGRPRPRIAPSTPLILAGALVLAVTNRRRRRPR